MDPRSVTGRHLRPITDLSKLSILDLPAEIRTQIWGEALVVDTNIRDSWPKGPSPIHILRTCREICNEATFYLYGKNTFDIVIRQWTEKCRRRTRFTSDRDVCETKILNQSLERWVFLNLPCTPFSIIQRFKVCADFSGVLYNHHFDYAMMCKNFEMVAQFLWFMTQIKYLAIDFTGFGNIFQLPDDQSSQLLTALRQIPKVEVCLPRPVGFSSWVVRKYQIAHGKWISGRMEGNDRLSAEQTRAINTHFRNVLAEAVELHEHTGWCRTLCSRAMKAAKEHSLDSFRHHYAELVARVKEENDKGTKKGTKKSMTVQAVGQKRKSTKRNRILEEDTIPGSAKRRRSNRPKPRVDYKLSWPSSR